VTAGAIAALKLADRRLVFESGVALVTVGAMSIDVLVMLLAAGRSTDC